MLKDRKSSGYERTFAPYSLTKQVAALSNPNSKKLDIHLLGRIMRQAKPYPFSFWTSAIIAVLLAPLATLRPYLIQQMVDEHIFFYDIAGL